MFRSLVAAALVANVYGDLPPAGAYKTAATQVTDEGLQVESGISSRNYHIVYPSSAKKGEKFPVVAFAHGFLAGGLALDLYNTHLAGIASYGFVVIAPKSCILGCSPPKDAVELSSSMDVNVQADCIPFTDGTRWTSFVHENTRALDYAKNHSSAPWASIIDWDAGAGIVGHSMGGETVSQMAAGDVAKRYNIKAAVCEHCQQCLKRGGLIETPAMFITGTGDAIVFPKQVKNAYNEDKTAPKSFRNDKGRGHLEVLDFKVQYNPAVASHAAAFLNVWLKGDKGDFYDQVYGNGTASFCGYEDMYECMHTTSQSVVV